MIKTSIIFFAFLLVLIPLNVGLVLAAKPITDTTATTITTTTVQSDFNKYTFPDGGKFPDGKLYVSYGGYGQVGIQDGHYFASPKVATSPSETHGALSLTTAMFGANYTINVDMRTDSQNRLNSPPNTWETAWIFFSFKDDFHQKYMVLKTNGFELGGKDNNVQNDAGQIYWQTLSAPKINLTNWQHITIQEIAGKTTVVTVDGVKVGSFNTGTNLLTGQPISWAGGKVGLYCEDSTVSFRNLVVTTP